MRNAVSGLAHAHCRLEARASVLPYHHSRMRFELLKIRACVLPSRASRMSTAVYNLAHAKYRLAITHAQCRLEARAYVLPFRDSRRRTAIRKLAHAYWGSIMSRMRSAVSRYAHAYRRP